MNRTPNHLIEQSVPRPVIEARMSGMRAAMPTASAREVPEPFKGVPHLEAAWLDAYDGMAQALRGCVPAEHRKRPRDEQKAPKAPKQAKSKPAAAKPVEPKKPVTMADILRAKHHEYA